MKMLCHLGKVSLWSFTSIIGLFTLLFLLPVNVNLYLNYQFNVVINPLIFFILANILIRLLSEANVYPVRVRASLLGFTFSIGLYIFLITPDHIKCFGLYMCVMSFFHYSEYFMISWIKPDELSINSFMLYHSPQYVIAAVFSWIEFGLESYFLPGMKKWFILSCIGLLVCVIGECMRKVAMFTAHSNFDHVVQFTKADNHELVTYGIYSVCRHPSYVGWFYWSIGTQIILLNPISIVGYACASWLFFNERINTEETTLLSFFGNEYYKYQQSVGTGLPFIKGYQMQL